MAKKNKSAKPRWVDIPYRDVNAWISDWIVSSLVLRAKEKLGRLPVRIRIPKDCMKEHKDGSATIYFDAE